MNETHIGWCDFTSNPIKYRNTVGETVWACVHASPGCEHCYAETLARRYGRGGPFTAPNMTQVTPYLDEKELRSLLTSLKLKGKRCFVEDMSDLFGEWVPDEMLDRLFAVMALRPDVTFQVLTKRADRMRRYFTDSVVTQRIDLHAAGLRSGVAITPNLITEFVERTTGDPTYHPVWPLPSVWLGVSVEDQRRADERIALLLQTPAAVRFLSVEPMLGPVELRGAGCTVCLGHGVILPFSVPCSACCDLDWVIVGGESGPGYRSMEIEWMADLVEQCRDAGVSVYVKQDSDPKPGQQGRLPDWLWAMKEMPR